MTVIIIMILIVIMIMLVGVALLPFTHPLFNLWSSKLSSAQYKIKGKPKLDHVKREREVLQLLRNRTQARSNWMTLSLQPLFYLTFPFDDLLFFATSCFKPP